MPDPSKTIRFSVSLPEELLSELDDRVIGRGYASRSEFVRDRIRELLVEDSWAEGSVEVFGVLAIIYNHHQRGLAAQIMEIQHRRHINVMCTTHVHIDRHNCLETIIMRGLPREIEDAAVAIGGLRGVFFHGLQRTSVVGPKRLAPEPKRRRK